MTYITHNDIYYSLSRHAYIHKSTSYRLIICTSSSQWLLLRPRAGEQINLLLMVVDTTTITRMVVRTWAEYLTVLVADLSACYENAECKKCQYRTLHWFFFSVFPTSNIILVYEMVPDLKCNGSAVKCGIHPTPIHIWLKSFINICLSLLSCSLTLLNKTIIPLFFLAPIKADHVGIRKLSKDVAPVRAQLKV